MDATVNTRVGSRAPAAWYALATALIVFAVAALLLFAGTRPHRLPPPFGPAANGRIYFDVDGGSSGPTLTGPTGRRSTSVATRRRRT